MLLQNGVPELFQKNFQKIVTFFRRVETHMRTFVNDVTGGGGTHFCETSYKGFLKTDF